MLEKGPCHLVFPAWAIALFPKGSGEDRTVFQALKQMQGRGTDKATSFYRLNPADANHAQRLGWIAQGRG